MKQFEILKFGFWRFFFIYRCKVVMNVFFNDCNFELNLCIRWLKYKFIDICDNSWFRIWRQSAQKDQKPPERLGLPERESHGAGKRTQNGVLIFQQMLRFLDTCSLFPVWLNSACVTLIKWCSYTKSCFNFFSNCRLIEMPGRKTKN